MTSNQQLQQEMSYRISELASLSHTLESLFTSHPSIQIDGRLFDGTSLFSMQLRMCKELSDMNDQLGNSLERRNS